MRRKAVRKYDAGFYHHVGHGWRSVLSERAGPGLIIAVLTLVFNIPIHTAVGTSLAAMIFTTLSGAFSHFREGNMNIKIGLTVGLSGACGAFIGSKISTLLPGSELKFFTASMLIASAILVYTRLTYPNLPLFHLKQGQSADLTAAVSGFWPD